MKIERPAKATYRVILTTKEAIRLIGRLADGINKQAVKHRNRLEMIKNKTRYRDDNEDEGTYVDGFYNDKPERAVRLYLEDIPIEENTNDNQP